MIEINNHMHAEWIAKNAGMIFNPECDMTISRSDKNGKIMGGAIYSNYVGSSVFVHAAGEGNWINRDMLWACFHYPFVKLGCKKLIGYCAEDNEEAVAFNKRMGFIEETRVEDVFPGGAALIFTMTRDQCRWLDIKPRNIKEGS